MRSFVVTTVALVVLGVVALLVARPREPELERVCHYTAASWTTTSSVAPSRMRKPPQIWIGGTETCGGQPKDGRERASYHLVCGSERRGTVADKTWSSPISFHEAQAWVWEHERTFDDVCLWSIDP